jgi:hypothetical protein
VNNNLPPLSGFLNPNILTSTLKQSIGDINKKVKENSENYSEDLEEFILRNSKELVESGIDAIHEIKQTVMMNPQSDEVEALAEIFNGVSSAMNILKDIQITKMKTKSTREIKQLEIDSKKQQEMVEEEEISQKGLRMTRDEIFKMLKENGDIVDTEFFSLSS